MMQQAVGLAPDINVLEAMNIFKNFPDEELPKYRNDPKLALFAAAEMDRRLRVRKDFMARQQKDTRPVVDQLQSQLGLQSIMPAAQPMPPQMQQPEQTPQLPQMPTMMAGGGPVAFNRGGITEEQQKEIDRKAFMESLESLYAAGKDILTLPGRGLAGAVETAITRPARAIGINIPYLPESFYGGNRQSMTPYYDQLRAARGQTPPAEPQEPKKSEQTATPIIKPQAAPPATAAPTAAQSPQSALDMLERLAGRYPLETPTPTDPAKIRKDAEAEEEYLRKKFPDKVSPMAEALAKELSTQISPEDARRQAFMQAAIAGLGYQGRDFGGGLAGMLEGYQTSKLGAEKANKEARVAAQKARLAAEEYKSAIERKDYESAKMYALELEKYRLQLIEAKNKATVGKLGIMGQIGQMLPKPEKPAKPKEVSFKDQFTLNKEVLELAMPEIQRLENQFDQEAKKWFGSIPKNWRQDPATKARFESDKQAIISRIRNQLDPRYSEAPPQTLSPDQIQRLREKGK